MPLKTLCCAAALMFSASNAHAQLLVPIGLPLGDLTPGLLGGLGGLANPLLQPILGGVTGPIVGTLVPQLLPPASGLLNGLLGTPINLVDGLLTAGTGPRALALAPLPGLE